MGYLHYGVKTGGVPIEMILHIIQDIQVKNFVETGTAGGESISVAAKHFENCATIEIEDGTVQEKMPNVRYLVGNSGDLLPEVIKSLKGYTVFWLDAHYSGSVEVDFDVEECPLLRELEAIKSCDGSIIVIDDARLFLSSPPWPLDPRKWPKLHDIFTFMANNFQGHHFTVIDDYIVCVPNEIKTRLFEYWRETFSKRYPSREERLRMSVSDSVYSLLNYINYGK